MWTLLQPSNDRIEVVMPGRGRVSLAAADHVATGGEGAVYIKDGYAFKIYLDPVKARTAGMPEKVKLLSGLRQPSIVAPIDVLLDRGKQPVGHYMDAVDGEPLVKMFTNTWRDAHRFGEREAAQLVENMRKTVQLAHDAQAVIVDGNEMNWRVQGVEPKLLDVDSWQIGRFPATALLPAVRDYHTARPSALSDWFTWGIVSFETLIGVHPYKGTHPDFRKGDLRARMLANASVFDSRVRLPASARGFGVIPSPLRGWYEGVFQDGERSAPPNVLAVATVPVKRKARTVQFSAGALRHVRVAGLPGRVTQVLENGIAVYEAPAGLQLYDLIRGERVVAAPPALVDALIAKRSAILRADAGLVCLEIQPGCIHASGLATERDSGLSRLPAAELPVNAGRLFLCGGRPFAVGAAQDGGLSELALDVLKDRLLLSHKATWPGQSRSMLFAQGLAVLDALGAPFLVVPQGGAMHFNRCDALRGYRVLDAIARGPEGAAVAAIRQSDGERCLIHLALQKDRYVPVFEERLEQADLNAAVTASGVATVLVEDGRLEVFRLGTGARTTIRDPALSSDMRLFALPSGIHYWLDNEIHNLSFS